ncbi:hypothetical protein P3342_013044 [Pyrenophora teres f. teres]|nr:hypothetical protein P3342_013044 [Pyrenophora teres f. teres]
MYLDIAADLPPNEYTNSTNSVINGPLVIEQKTQQENVMERMRCFPQVAILGRGGPCPRQAPRSTKTERAFNHSHLTPTPTRTSNDAPYHVSILLTITRHSISH